MKLFAGRQSQLKSLFKAKLLGASAFVSGLKGVGKTGLVKQFEKENSYKFLYLNFDQKQSLSQILSFELGLLGYDLPSTPTDELLLKLLIDTSKKYDAIVFENIDMLASSYQSLLINFFNKHASDVLTIYISRTLIDDSIFDLEYVNIKLSNLSKEEVQGLIDQSLLDLSDINIDHLYQATKGNPLLVNLYILSDGDISNYWNKELKKVSGTQLDGLIYLSLFNRPIPSTWLKDIDQDIGLFKSLENSLLINSLYAENEMLESLIDFDILQKIVSTQKIDTVRQKLVQRLIKDEYSKMECIYHILQFEDISLTRELIKDIRLYLMPNLDSYHKKFIADLAFQCEGFLEKKGHDEYSQTIITRVLVNSLFLLGKRVDSLTYFEAYMHRFSDHRKYKIQAKLLMLEYTQQLNRFGKYEKAKEVTSSFITKDISTLNILFRVELLTSMMDSELELAHLSFNKLITEVSSFCEDSKEYDIALSQLYFQFARCLYALDKLNESYEYFKKSVTLFDSLSRPYFSLVAKLNISWIEVKKVGYSINPEFIENSLIKANNYRFDYISAGFSLLLAKLSRHRLEFDKSGQYIKQCIKALGDNPPFAPYQDVILEKIRILIHSGKRSLALHEFQLFCKYATDRNYEFRDSKDYKIIKIELDCFGLTHNEEFSRWQEITIDPYEEDHKSLHLSYIGLGHSYQEDLELSDLQKICLYTGKMYKGLKENDLSCVKNALIHISKLCELSNIQSEYQCFSYLCSLFLRSSNVTDESLYTDFLEVIKNISLDSEIKDAVSATVYNFIKLNGYSWNNVARRDINRYQLFHKVFTDTKNAKYTKISLDEQSLVEDYSIDKSVDFVFIEERGELYHRGELLKSFTRRKKLRDLLAGFFNVQRSILSKNEIVPIVWGEVYDPLTHDSRVYTSIQRLKDLININDILLKDDHGYVWNPKYSFNYFKTRHLKKHLSLNRNQVLILEVFKSFKKNNKDHLSRKTLVLASGLSESQVKRELNELLEMGLLSKSGLGRSVKYTLSS